MRMIAMVTIDSINTITNMSCNNKPIACVNPGELLIVNTLDCFSNKIKNGHQLLKDIPWTEINPATGPIYVDGAEAGDVLRISIIDIRVNQKAVVLCESEDLDRYECKGNESSLFVDIANGNAIITDDISIQCIPMIGVIGTAPEKGDIPTTLPGFHGGNMDNTHIKKGSEVFLPVFHKGALLALGDLHAVMGDGESTGSGLEIGGEVSLRIDVIKNCNMPLPMVKTNTSIETVASAESLDAASVMAVKNMLQYLTTYLGIEMQIAWKMVSACGDVGICQFANAIKTARCCLPIQYVQAFADKNQVN